MKNWARQRIYSRKEIAKVCPCWVKKKNEMRRREKDYAG